MTDVTLGASGLWLGTQKIADGSAFSHSPWLHLGEERERERERER